jgi:AP-3 complex subunit delta
VERTRSRTSHQNTPPTTQRSRVEAVGKLLAKCEKAVHTLICIANSLASFRFEKSLYDLIQGLRKHKGNEREYIQDSIRECRKEIRTQDMNLKATALLKLTYLEMFGYDMSWASFHVLEVMSSQNYVQKKVGYLGAIQSFRPDTEVLMLAENLLKKDLMSPTPVVIALPLTAIPHVINPSMANSLLADLLPRLTHSHAAIRKKTIVTLYRLALVYPETLRPAWPKIKERLQDENEDPSVTAAIVNVVCELGWRRPQDFLPLAPRLFDLLVQGGNNWMAIKIIKLFATLTPLEPRLIKKLLPPLTSIIKETPAMSLLYECINGIIQGGILEGADGTTEGEEIARLCVGKLRSMLVVEDDPNLKYVALLAFQKIVTSHPHLVQLHQDVILECIDDGDISIRSRALDLVVGMVNSENLATIVEKLLRQLRNAPAASAVEDVLNDRGAHEGIMPAADDSDEEAEASLRRGETQSDQPPPLPEEYRIQVLRNILDMCSHDTYANINDFEWYVEVLVQLVRACPTVATSSPNGSDSDSEQDISTDIGHELRNVAVRVKAMRPEATNAAQSLIMIDQRDGLFPPFGNGGQGVLESAAWMVGEYAECLNNPDGVINSLLDSSSLQLPARILAIYIHAIPKVFATLAGSESVSWTPQRRTYLSLLMAKIVHFLEPLATHPDLEVQERAVEYLELMRLSSEAASGHPVSRDGEFQEPPLLLTQAIPSLFSGMELNPVAPGAQRKVPPPGDLDLDAPINENLQSILRQADQDDLIQFAQDEFETFYNQHVDAVPIPEAAADRLALAEKEQASCSYQNSSEDDVELLARRRAERKERYKDDPFYIGGGGEGTASNKIHNIIRGNNGDDLDIDSIPIMNLDLNDGSRPSSSGAFSREQLADAERRRKAANRKNFEITVDENLGEDEPQPTVGSFPGRSVPSRARRNPLEVDSSGLGSLSLEDSGRASKLDIEQREEEERALREVERLRLEMQRASERIHAKEESTVVRKKKRKVKPKEPEMQAQVPAEEAATPVVKKKKKKKAPADDGAENVAREGEAVAKPKKKKKRQIDLTGPPPETEP